MYPKSLEKLVSFFKKLPGVGAKSAERYALSVIKMSDNDLENFSELIANIKEDIKECKICGALTDNEVCSICSNSNRDDNLICVVEDYKSLVSFEKAGNYNGKYHVLNGLISPINNVGPQDINISSLVKRIDNQKDVELILALKSSIEGETTTLYIKKIFETKNITISRLSYGLPMGAEIDYLDILTLDKALEDRKKIS